MLVNIQFLRFVAAMLVVLYHTASRLPANDSLFQGLLGAGESMGFAGVDIFFVISGFIMAHTTIGFTGSTDSIEFAKRRLARIFSGYWPFFILTALIFAYLRPNHFAESHLLASFFLWPQSLNHVLLEISWTLSYELYFYLLFSVMILFFRPQRHFSIVLVTFALLLVFNVYRHFVAHSFSPANIYYQPFWVLFLSSPFLLEFFSGSLLAWWLAKNNVAQQPSARAWLWFLSGSSLFLAGGWINNIVYNGLIEQGFHTLPRVFVYGIPAVMIVAGLVRMERGGWRAPVQFSLLTGGASYAIYLSHILILTLVWNSRFGHFVNGLPTNLMVAVYLSLMLAILALSVLHYHWLEQPLHQTFKRWLRVRRTN